MTSDPASVRDMYEAVADSYSQMMDAEIEQPLYADILGRLCERIRDLPGPVVDAACGSGHMLGWLQARFDPPREVIGVDLSPRMVALTAERLASTGRAVVGDMARLPLFADGSVAALINYFALHHLDSTQSSQALNEWRRVLMPGGQLIVAAWEGEGPIDYGEQADIVAVRIRAEALRTWAEDAGFTVDRCVVEPVDDFPMDAIYLEATAPPTRRG